MAYDEGLAERLRAFTEARPECTERKMFGGLCVLVNGNMACGVLGDELVVRLGEDGAEAALSEDGVKPFDFTGRPMKTMVMISQDVLEEDEELGRWVEQGMAFSRTLPPK